MKRNLAKKIESNLLAGVIPATAILLASVFGTFGAITAHADGHFCSIQGPLGDPSDPMYDLVQDDGSSLDMGYNLTSLQQELVEDQAIGKCLIMAQPNLPICSIQGPYGDPSDPMYDLVQADGSSIDMGYNLSLLQQELTELQAQRKCALGQY
jgi:hypothetical protein